jgi:hypothetical protein
MVERIKDTIQAVFKDLTAKKGSFSKGSPEDWLKKTLTKRELEHIKFNYFRKGILGVKVDSSSWLYKFNLEKARILAKLRPFSQELKDIHFRIGEVK